LIWERIEDRLKRLSNRISNEDYDAIVKAIAKKIGRPPTKAQRAAIKRKTEKLLNGIVERLTKT
jgi:hypothetical protein